MYLVNTVSQPMLVPLIEDVEVVTKNIEAQHKEAHLNDVVNSVTQNNETNFNEVQSDEDGLESDDMFEDSADEYIMDDEVVINNVVNVEPEKKKKNKGGRPKKQTLLVTNQITQIREVKPESDEDFSFNIAEKRKRALRLRESDETTTQVICKLTYQVIQMRNQKNIILHLSCQRRWLVISGLWVPDFHQKRVQRSYQ